jgi:hypothetical protein
MPGEILGAILQPVVEFAGYCIARVVFPAITLGRVRVEKLGDRLTFPWYGLVREQRGRWVVHGELSAAIGFLLFMGIAGFCIWRFY